METRETGKTRSQRIQIDYYRHRGGLFWCRWGCVLAGLVGAVAYTAMVVGSPDPGPHLSTGTLSVSHASFEKDCQQCHQDFTPLAGDALRIDPVDSIQHTESACQTCHRVGDHFRSVLATDWKLIDQDCATCHREHLGRDHNLVAIADQQCAQCHANLSAVCMPTHVRTVKPELARFTLEDHGDFKSLTAGDSGRVMFDHRQHLRPGQVDQGNKGGFTIEMLEPSHREQYRLEGQSDQEPVTLQCSSCHQFAGNPDAVTTLAADAELGRYLAPISFDEHCAACHALNPPGRGEQTLPLPHAAPWTEINLLLKTKISGLRALGSARSPRDDSQPTPLPGVGFGAVKTNVAIVSEPEIAATRDLLRQQCLKCHDADSITEAAIDKARTGQSPALIPPRWLKHGLYDHAAHRSIDCRYCHEPAFSNQEAKAEPPNDHQHVMIAGIETCTPCHRAPEAAAPEQLAIWGGQPTWASDRCSLCHRYHSAETSP